MVLESVTGKGSLGIYYVQSWHERWELFFMYRVETYTQKWDMLITESEYPFDLDFSCDLAWQLIRQLRQMVLAFLEELAVQNRSLLMKRCMVEKYKHVFIWIVLNNDQEQNYS